MVFPNNKFLGVVSMEQSGLVQRNMGSLLMKALIARTKYVHLRGQWLSTNPSNPKRPTKQ